MNEKEMRELDVWIGVNVFGKKAIHRDGPKPTEGTEDDYFVIEFIHISHSLHHYSTDPAAAMLVLEKCAEKRREASDPYCPDVTLSIHAPHPDWENLWVVASDPQHTITGEAATLPLAIALFAKKLFGNNK